ncbi:competence type IV pilus minor pilin ComGD [Shouchella shacheensis]|uniref:competence type IV pilus minor pilin ComGD n=1 Tax=Shouchella shacheensis TaxID=1649580 RepID=UPI0007401E1E|nr:competence type IV pilus minor pilin ComGD [Shouchella shacheensis]
MNERGFTLVELLLSLTILSMMILLPILLIPNFHQNNEAKQIAGKIREDLLIAQQVAMAQGKTARVQFRQTEKAMLIFVDGRTFEKIPYVDEGMSFSSRTMDIAQIGFLANGHPQRAGTFEMAVHGKRYAYTLHIGKGRVTYREL